MVGTGDGEHSLAHGMVVETRLVVRLLGMPLLQLDGVIVVAPSPPTLEEFGAIAVQRTNDDSAELRLLPDRGTVGADLGEAARILAQLRNDSSVRGGLATRHR